MDQSLNLFFVGGSKRKGGTKLGLTEYSASLIVLKPQKIFERPQHTFDEQHIAKLRPDSMPA